MIYDFDIKILIEGYQMALRRVISIKYVMKRKLLKRKEKEKKTKGIKRITRGGGGRTKRG